MTLGVSGGSHPHLPHSVGAGFPPNSLHPAAAGHGHPMFPPSFFAAAAAAGHFPYPPAFAGHPQAMMPQAVNPHENPFFNPLLGAHFQLAAARNGLNSLMQHQQQRLTHPHGMPLMVGGGGAISAPNLANSVESAASGKKSANEISPPKSAEISPKSAQISPKSTSSEKGSHGAGGGAKKASFHSVQQLLGTVD